MRYRFPWLRSNPLEASSHFSSFFAVYSQNKHYCYKTVLFLSLFLIFFFIRLTPNKKSKCSVKSYSKRDSNIDIWYFFKRSSHLENGSRSLKLVWTSTAWQMLSYWSCKVSKTLLTQHREQQFVCDLVHVCNNHKTFHFNHWIRQEKLLRKYNLQFYVSDTHVTLK